MDRFGIIENEESLQQPGQHLAGGSRQSPSAGKTRIARLMVFFGSERQVSVVLLLALLPWVCVCMIAAGSRAALDLVAFAAVVFLVGYGVLSAAISAKARTGAIVLAPAAGVVTLSALSAFLLRLGLPLLWATFVWLTLAVAGLICARRDRSKLEKSTLDYGFALVLLSAIICAIYFVPGAFNDAVLRQDGSFAWFSVDTQYYHSMVEAIRISEGKPKMPGTFTSDLYYHFGPYALPAAVSAISGISTGDALVRVSRGVEQWALIFSCLGLGTLLSLKATKKTFGGLLSVGGLFFYGSFLSLFSGIVNPRPVAPWPALFESGGQFPTNAGPFSHILLGVSVLHGLEAITVIMALCIVQRDTEITKPWRVLTILTLPALTVAVNLPAAAYCLGVVAIVLFWGHLIGLRPWFYMGAMFAMFLGAYWLIGYSHAPHMEGGIQLSRVPIYWWTFVMWFGVALGIRVISFGWVTQRAKDPIAVLVVVSFLGLLVFSWVGAFWMENGKYGVYYLQALFSIFAFSRLPSRFWRADQRDEWIREWLSIEKKGLIIFAIVGVSIGIFSYLIHRVAGVPYFRERIPICVGFILIVAVLSLAMDRRRRLSAAVSAVIVTVLLVGFLGWIPPWFKYRTGWQSYNVTVTPGEVAGLERLHEVALRGERFATNKHTLTGESDQAPANSYAYGTLSGLPVLLEGYHDGAEENLAGFSSVQRDNDLLFNTTNQEVLKGIAHAYDIRWLVLRPGTDLKLPKPLPSWLVEQEHSGDLKIYRVG